MQYIDKRNEIIIDLMLNKYNSVNYFILFFGIELLAISTRETDFFETTANQIK